LAICRYIRIAMGNKMYVKSKTKFKSFDLLIVSKITKIVMSIILFLC
jgi:hypothetical protein